MNAKKKQLRQEDYLEHMLDAIRLARSYKMRGMRNRMAHGYFEINMDIVWDTVQDAFPDLERQIAAIERTAV